MSAELQEEDLTLDRSLRPKYLKDYLGQARIKESLAIMIEAAKAAGIYDGAYNVIKLALGI